mmetsp:Transcript_49137/g.110605  ORF Transcript_49137/g.110605 Transcript_49137/m.110605 type:complete len:212 (+) Transcript_49137:200-835(+)
MMPSPRRSMAENRAFVMDVVGAVAVTPGREGADRKADSVGGTCGATACTPVDVAPSVPNDGAGCCTGGGMCSCDESGTAGCATNGDGTGAAGIGAGGGGAQPPAVAAAHGGDRASGGPGADGAENFMPPKVTEGPMPLCAAVGAAATAGGGSVPPGFTSTLLWMAVKAMGLNSSRVMIPSPLRSIALNSAFVIDAVAMATQGPGDCFKTKQ